MTRSTQKRLGSVLLVIALVSLFAIYARRDSGGAIEAGKTSNGTAASLRPALPVQAMIVQPSSLEQHLYATGTVLANEEVDLRSEIPGRITSINFSEGSQIQRGALLLKINDADLRATLKKLEAQLDVVKRAEVRAKSLLAQKLVSDEEYDDAASKVQTLEAEIEHISSDFEKTEIRAPFTGVIGLRSVSVGSTVTSATPIARMQQIDPVKIEFAVPEKYAQLVAVGRTIRFTTNSTLEPYTGKIYAIEPKIDLATRTLRVRAIAANRDRQLMPGSLAKVILSLATIDDALAVPTRSVIPELAGQKVFVLRSGAAKAVQVTTGLRSDSTVEITSGLGRGDTLITTGVLQLREGTQVNVTTIQ